MFAAANSGGSREKSSSQKGHLWMQSFSSADDADYDVDDDEISSKLKSTLARSFAFLNWPAH